MGALKSIINSECPKQTMVAVLGQAWPSSVLTITVLQPTTDLRRADKPILTRDNPVKRLL